MGHDFAQEDPVEHLFKRLLVGQQIPVDSDDAARRQIFEVWAREVRDGGAIGKQGVSEQRVLSTADLQGVERLHATECCIRRDQTLVAIAIAEVVVAPLLEGVSGSLCKQGLT